MEVIAKLIYIALEEAFDCCAIEWHPEDGIPEPLMGECTIEPNPWNSDVYIEILGAFVIIDMRTMKAWHATNMREYVRAYGSEEAKQAYGVGA